MQLFAFALYAALSASPTAGLSQSQRQAFDSIAKEEFCHCQSALTIAGCLELRPGCKVGEHLGAFIAKGLQNGQSPLEIQSTLSTKVMGPYCARQKTLEVDQAPSLGKGNAPITVVEFADFRCGHCKNAAPLVKKALSRFGDKVRFVFVPFPLGNHPLSVLAAEAALAAGAQGKFFEMADLLFAHQGEVSQAVVDGFAKKLGLDLARFEKDLTTHAHKATLDTLRAQGEKAGIQGTPSFFVNGRPYTFDPDVYTLAHRFEMELDRNNGSCQ